MMTSAGKKIYTPTLYEPTLLLKELFVKYGIGFDGNILDEILAKKIEIKEFYKQFKFIFDLISQTRNKDNMKNDFILSPVENDEGVKFDSRTYISNNKLPRDADANGAYNIARKGLIIIDRIKQLSSVDKKLDLYISDTEWSKFASQNKIFR